MDNYRMNRSGQRPYNRTCGMMTSAPMPANSCCQMPSAQASCPCSKGDFSDETMYDYLKHLTPAMAYVPLQTFTTVYEPDYALCVGTVFPQLCKPFCGKRGVRR